MMIQYDDEDFPELEETKETEVVDVLDDRPDTKTRVVSEEEQKQYGLVPKKRALKPFKYFFLYLFVPFIALSALGLGIYATIRAEEAIDDISVGSFDSPEARDMIMDDERSWAVSRGLGLHVHRQKGKVKIYNTGVLNILSGPGIVANAYPYHTIADRDVEEFAKSVVYNQNDNTYEVINDGLLSLQLLSGVARSAERSDIIQAVDGLTLYGDGQNLELMNSGVTQLRAGNHIDVSDERGSIFIEALTFNIFQDISISAAELADGGEVTIQPVYTASERYRIVSIFSDYTESSPFVGGNREILVGNDSYYITQASLISSSLDEISLCVGSSGYAIIPIKSMNENDAEQSITVRYRGGTTDYTNGHIMLRVGLIETAST